MLIRITLSDGSSKRIYVTDPKIKPLGQVIEIKEIAIIHILDREGQLCREVGVSDENGVLPDVNLVLLPDGLDAEAYSLKMRYQIVINGFTYNSDWSELVQLVDEETS